MSTATTKPANFTEFSEVVAAIKRRGRDGYSNEEEAKDIVKQILRSLGWPSSPTDDDPIWVVKPQYAIKGWRKNYGGIVDIAIALRTQNKPEITPIVFIEAKKVKPAKFSKQEQDQLLDYCLNKKVPIGVLTNGFDWHIYLKPESLTERDKAGALAIEVATDQGEISDIFEALKRSLGRGAVSEGKLGKGGAAEKFLSKVRNKRIMNKAWDLLLNDECRSLHKALATEVRKILEQLLDKKPLPWSIRKDDQIKVFVENKCAELVGDRHPPRANKDRASPEAKAPFPQKGEAPSTTAEPTYFYVFGKKMEFHRWGASVRIFLDEASKRDPNSPEKLADALPKKFIRSSAEPSSRYGKPLGRWQRAHRIGNSDVWAILEQNQSYMRRICRDVQKVLDLPEDTMKFE